MSIVPDRKLHSWPDRAFWRGFAMRLWIGFALTFAVLGAWLMAMPAANRDAILSYWGQVRVPAPSFDLAPLLALPISAQIHVAAAVVALAVGALIFSLPKGTGFHRFIGWSWVGSMIVVAGTSVAMIADFGGTLNPLHVFTAVTVLSLWGGLAGIRRGNVSMHAGSMTGLYVGGLIIAGVFAFIPGRTMWNVFFGG
ncbi:MAG: hypothetical protein K8S25_15745 [Alphaproteobacteria bacterium]|nr:hypothetical protein [Alphaproteobacteria bacterium]